MPRNGASEITKEGDKLRPRKPYREVECYVPQRNLVMLQEKRLRHHLKLTFVVSLYSLKERGVASTLHN